MTLRLQGISKSFGRNEVVKNLDLEVREGEFVSLLGPSGCGKSTTLYMIAGLERPSAGSVSLGGEDITLLPPNERDMAIVFQNYALYPHMSVAQNIGFGLKLRGAPRNIRERIVGEVAAILRIDGLLDRRPGQLSGGQQQRVAIARALAKQPSVFLFDEPLSNLDAALRERLRIEIRRLHLEVGATSVFVTHDQEEAMTMSDRIAVMQNGRILQIGTPEEIYSRPDPLFVAEFVGRPGMNLLAGEISFTGRGLAFRNRALALDWEQPGDEAGAFSGAGTVGVRPEDLLLRPEEAAGTLPMDYATARGTVSLVQPTGPDTYVEVALGDAHIVARASSRERYQRGQGVVLGIPFGHLHVFDGTGKRRN